MIVEAQKKLNTHQTFDPEDVKWTAPNGYASRYVPWPDGALQIDHVFINGTRYNEADVQSVNLLGSNEYLVKDNKLWFAFIPSIVTISCRKIPVGSDGLPMVNENHLDAICWFIMFKFDYAEFRKDPTKRILMRETELRKDHAFRQARGSDNMPNWVENRKANANLSAVWSRTYGSPKILATLNSNFVGTEVNG